MKAKKEEVSLSYRVEILLRCLILLKKHSTKRCYLYNHKLQYHGFFVYEASFKIMYSLISFVPYALLAKILLTFISIWKGCLWTVYYHVNYQMITENILNCQDCQQ